MVAGHNDGCADLIVFVGGGILFSYILNKWRQSVWSFDVECVCVCFDWFFFSIWFRCRYVAVECTARNGGFLVSAHQNAPPIVT